MNEKDLEKLERRLNISIRRSLESDIMTSGQRNLFRELIKIIEAQQQADATLSSAARKYHCSENLLSPWRKKAIVDSIIECSLSKIFQEEADYSRLKAFLYAHLTDVDDLMTFLMKMEILINKSYFINLDSEQIEIIKNFLIALFNKKGINDVIELLYKIKFLEINISNKPIIKTKNGIKVVNEGLTSYEYFKAENGVVVDMRSIKITIGKNLENEYKELAIWQELSLILNLPIHEIVPHSELEGIKEEYFRTLMTEPVDRIGKK